MRRYFTAFTLLLLLSSGDEAVAKSLSIDDPATLESLEDSGLDFSRWVLGAENHVANNQQLNKNPRYLSLVKDISAELDAIARRDPLLSVTMASGHRLFNKNWLNSDKSNFELVGIINRIDRLPFLDESCGEVRFIYRLAYRFAEPKASYSRLPMTLNAVYHLRKIDGSCQVAAKKWLTAQATGKKPTLSKDALEITHLKSLEVNLQVVRWPSTVRPDMGGYAEYLMRVYTLDGSAFVPSHMENMPDVEKLARQPALKKELMQWIRQPNVLASIDQGIAVVPKKFLATKAVSAALAGSHRLANAPFSRVFTEADFSHLDYNSFRTVKSAHGLLRRLNDLSCVGCHQGRTVAGFHFLGRDRPETDDVNSIHVSSSPHFIMDQPRRQRYFDAVLTGKTTEAFRDFSFRSPEDRGLMGSHCGLGDATFLKWTCAQGLECRDTYKDSRVSHTGVCMPKQANAGSSCQTGSIKHDMNPHKDRVKLGTRTSCGESMHCEDVSVGFPAGMCSGDCKNVADGEICGSIAVLHDFNSCLAQGKQSFSQCLSNNVRPGKLQECSDTKLCRDDFICTRVGQSGGCIPPYFLFQLRVDGHPKP